MKKKKDLENLGVEEDAGTKTLHLAFREQAKQRHPDMHQGSKEAGEDFRQLKESYEALKKAREKEEQPTEPAAKADSVPKTEPAPKKAAPKPQRLDLRIIAPAACAVVVICFWILAPRHSPTPLTSTPSKQQVDLAARAKANWEKVQLADALSDYSAALEVSPRDPVLLENRAQVYAQLGEMELAQMDLEQAISHENRIDAQARYQWRRATIRGGLAPTFAQLQGKIVYLRQAMKAKAGLYSDLAQATLLSESPDAGEADPERSLAIFGNLIQANPTADTFEARGGAYLKQKQYALALADFDRAIDLDPQNPLRVFRRGLCLAEAGELERAVLDYDKALSLSPTLHQVLPYRASAQFQLGKLALARVDYSAALLVAKEPSVFDLSCQLSKVLFKEGDVKAARSQLDTVPTDWRDWASCRAVFAEMANPVGPSAAFVARAPASNTTGAADSWMALLQSIGQGKPPDGIAASAWDLCLQKGNFSYEIKSFLENSREASKNACKLHFTIDKSKWKKVEINVCDPEVHVMAYSSLDGVAERIVASKSACESGAHAGGEFESIRARVFSVFTEIQEIYAPDHLQADLGNNRDFRADTSRGRVACGWFLLKGYLERCASRRPQQSGN